MKFSNFAEVLLLTVIGAAFAQDQDVAAAVGPAVTDGDCSIDVRLQAEGETPIGVPTDWHPDDNIIVKLAGSTCDVGVSPTWTISGWENTIVQIAPNTAFKPPALADNKRQLVKIMRGTLLDVNVNGIFTDGHWETHAVNAPNRAFSMYVDSAVDEIMAGEDGAVIVYMTVTEEILSTPITDMTSSPVTDMAGPYSENLKWNKFADVTDWGFDGVEFWNMAGILLQENDGTRLANMQWWTFREDFNADNYHDHAGLTAENAFGEIHMAMYAPNGVSGMQTTLMGTENKNYTPNPEDLGIGNTYNQNDNTEVQIAIPMPPGYAHGPLWSVEPDTGEPTRMCSGAVQYPPHRWLISANGAPNEPLRYVMWVAYEHLPEDVTVPLKMITEWPNANLQNTMTPAECAAVEDPTSPGATETAAPADTAEVEAQAADLDEDAPSSGAYFSYPTTLVAVVLGSILVAIA